MFLTSTGWLALALSVGVFAGCSHHSGQVSGGCPTCGGGGVAAAGTPTAPVATASTAARPSPGAVAATDTPVGPQTVPASAQVPNGDMFNGQKTCPVLGKPLGASAVAVTVKGQTIYVCCSRCVAAVQSNPDVYLTRVAIERSNNTAAAPR
jgi:hypothetical protein